MTSLSLTHFWPIVVIVLVLAGYLVYKKKSSTSTPSPTQPPVQPPLATPPPTVITPPATTPPPVATQPPTSTQPPASTVRPEYTSVNFKHKYPAGSCNLTDAMYLYKMLNPFNTAAQGKVLVGTSTLYFYILAGSQIEISQATNPAYADIAKSQKFDPTTYTGPLKVVYDELLAGILNGTIVNHNCYADTGALV
jgi:hypothetical protein